MNGSSAPDAYGELVEPTTLRIQRLLPGPVERIWAYLVDGEKRRFIFGDAEQALWY